MECLARADRVTRARWQLAVVVLGWQARDQLADPAELLERGLHPARERRIFEYLAGAGVGDRLSVADERLALLCQLPEGLLDVVEAGERALAFRGEQVYAVKDALGFGAVGGGHDGQDVLDVGAAVRGVGLHQRVEAQQVAQLGLFLIAGCGLAGFPGAGRVVVCHGAHAPMVPQVDDRPGIATPTGIAAAQTVAGWWPAALWRSDHGAALPGARRHLPGRDLVELAVWPGPLAHPSHQVTIGRIITEVDELRGIALRLAEADAGAFTAVTGACKLPRSTEEEKAARCAAIAQALASAAWPPAQVISVAGMMVDLAQALAAIGNPNVISDAAAAAAEAARAACSQAVSSSARSTQSRPASGKLAVSIANRIRSPASPWSEVIACSGIVTSSRRSPGPMLPSVADVTPSQPPHAQADPRARVLTALPGVGQFTALVMLAEIGDITRFPSVRKLASWAGLGWPRRSADLTSPSATGTSPGKTSRGV